MLRKPVCLLIAAVASWTQGATGQTLDVRQFVQNTYFEGLPYEQAASYSPTDVPVLLEMLSIPVGLGRKVAGGPRNLSVLPSLWLKASDEEVQRTLVIAPIQEEAKR